jgi:hypothetical protein
MEPVKNTFLTRLESVRAELRALAKLIPEVEPIENIENNDDVTLPDLVVAQLWNVTHFHFRLDPSDPPTKFKISFLSRSIGDNQPDIDFGDFY